jgi:fatty acid desaturase
MAHFTEPHHRIHDLSFAFLNATTTVGMLAQLRRPTRNIAGQLMALIPFAALLLSVALTNASVLSPPWLLVGAAAVLATMFHPVGDPIPRSVLRAWIAPCSASSVSPLCPCSPSPGRTSRCSVPARATTPCSDTSGTWPRSASA